MINLITSIIYHKNRYIIGKNNDLITKIPQDIEYFKNITCNSYLYNLKNVVVMGRKTWFSIPSQNRPLYDRINIVLTRDSSLIKSSTKYKRTNSITKVYFMNLSNFIDLYLKYNWNVFIIGGADIFNIFLNENIQENLRPKYLYITDIKGLNLNNNEEYIYIKNIPDYYELCLISEKMKQPLNSGGALSFRFLKYKLHNKYHEEKLILNTLSNILQNGCQRSDSNNIETIDIFGTQLHFDISQTIPLLTTRFIPIKIIIEELLWFLRGDTDAKILNKKGIKIWDGHTNRAFLDSRNLYDYENGILGPGYGFQMRFFGAEYSQFLADTSEIDIKKVGGFDQLQYVLHLLQTDPYSRRIMMSYWNPLDFDKTALIPNHTHVQFFVEYNVLENQNYLSCQFYMRSNDFTLSNNIEIVSYSILTYILALKCNMKPKKIIYTCGDTYVYKTHIDIIKEQLTKNIHPFPVLLLNNSIKTKDWKDINIDDFDLVGYFPNY